MTLSTNQPLILRKIIPIDEVNALTNDILQLLWAVGAEGENIDTCVLQLNRQNRSALSAVYDTVRECNSFFRLILSSSLLRAIENATGTTHLHSPMNHTVFRMDLPSENWRGFGWHQDLPYNMLSQNSVTMWTPLTPASTLNGSIEVAANTSDRNYPVEIRAKRDPDGKCMGGLDAFIPKRFHSQFESDAVTLSLSPGDAVLFSPQLVHRSGYNPGPSVRFSVQARYGDLLAPEVTKRRWAHRREEGFHTFKNNYPELVEFEEKQ